jgi:hypothetical protein
MEGNGRSEGLCFEEEKEHHFLEAPKLRPFVLLTAVVQNDHVRMVMFMKLFVNSVPISHEAQ